MKHLQSQSKVYVVPPNLTSLIFSLWSSICEICGATALNVTGGQANEASNATITTMEVSNAPAVLSETRRFWHGRRVINFLLACMIFAFVVSWLFHFKIFPWSLFEILPAVLVLIDITNNSTLGDLWCRGIFGLRNFQPLFELRSYIQGNGGFW